MSLVGCFNRFTTEATPKPRKRLRHMTYAGPVIAIFGCAGTRSETSLSCTSENDSDEGEIAVNRYGASIIRPTLDYRCVPPITRSLFVLKRLMRPTRDAERRRENCLHVWVQEAKGLTGRHKYHCEILLDSSPCARTTSKRLTDMLFWGEEFDLSGLPDFENLSVELWIDPESVDDCSSAKTNRPRVASSQTSVLRQVNGAPQLRKAVMTCSRCPDNRLSEKGCPTNEDTAVPASGTEHGVHEHRSKTSSPVAKSCSAMASRKATVRRDRCKGEKGSADSSLIATVIIPKSSLQTAMEVENWYPVSYRENGPSRKRSEHVDIWSGKGRTAKKESSSPSETNRTIQLRIKTRYRSVVVLPLVSYSRLQSHLAQFRPPYSTHTSDESTQTDSALFLSNLDPWLSVKAKAELAGSIVALHQALRQTTNFLAVLILHEVHKQADPNMVLRGNSIATKATEIYLRLVGETYLPIILSDFVRTVIGGVGEAIDTSEQLPAKTAKHLRHTATVTPSEVSNGDCEVDTTRVQNSAQLAVNQANLLRLVQMVWEKIIASEPHFPNQLRLLFATVRKQLDIAFPNDKSAKQHGASAFQASMAEHVISACLFLRYICPAILSPSLFGLAPEFPSNPKVLRAFTLVAKAIQSLANFSLFSGTKEVYMTFMNQFVMEQLPSMRKFLHAISTPKPVLQHSIHSPIASCIQNDCHRLFNSQSHHEGFGSTEGRTLRHQSLLTRSTSSGLPSAPSPYRPHSQEMLDNGETLETKRFREPIMLPALPTTSPIPSDDSAIGDHIDLALCLALCHCQLSEALSKIPTDKMASLDSRLKPILEEIDFFLVSGVEPNPNWWNSSRQASTEEITPTIDESNNNASVKCTTAHTKTTNTKNHHGIHARLTGSANTEQKELMTSGGDLMPHSELVEITSQHKENEAIELSDREDGCEFTPHVDAVCEDALTHQMKYVQRPIPSKPNRLTVSTVTNHETTDPKEEDMHNMSASLFSSKVLPVRHTPPPRGNVQHTVPQYILPPVYLNRENQRRTKGQTHQTMKKGVVCLPTGTQTPPGDLPWSIETEQGQSLEKPITCAEKKLPGALNKTQMGKILHLNHACTTLSNSTSHQSPEIHENSGYTTTTAIPVTVGKIENNTKLKTELYPGLPIAENPAVSNPLYTLHVRANETFTPSQLEPVSGNPHETDSEFSVSLQTSPSRSKSFTDQHVPRRHTYVNLTGNTTTPEMLLSSMRDESQRCSEEMSSLVDSHGRTNQCCTLETSAADYSSFEAITTSSIPLDERRGSISSGSSHRTIVTLEGYEPRPYCSVSEGARSIGHDTYEQTMLAQSEPTNNVSIQRELDASHARLAEAQARLLANEAERIQLLRVWHNELMRQSQLSGYASWGPNTKIERQAISSKMTNQMNTSGGSVALNSSSIESSLRDSSTTASYSTPRIHRSVYSAKPRMGASVISATYHEATDVEQSTLPRGRVPNEMHQDRYTSDRVAMARSPSSPGLLSTNGGPITKIQLLEINGDQSLPDTDSGISALPSQDYTSQYQSE